MFVDRKIWLSTLLAISILAIIILGAGLSQFELERGELFGAQAVSNLAALLQAGFSLQNLVYILLFLGFLMVIFALVTSAKGEQAETRRRRSWLSIITFFLWILAIYSLREHIDEQSFTLDIPEINSGIGSQGSEPIVNPVAAASPWATFAISFFLLLAVGIAIWFIWRRLQSKPKSTVEEIERDARAALQDLQAGVDLRNVILRCYFDMCQAINRQQGIRRQEAMTPREFELKLIDLGLPREPVVELTRLFESARYGAQEPNQRAEEIAERCLTAIILSSRRIA